MCCVAVCGHFKASFLFANEAILGTIVRVFLCDRGSVFVVGIERTACGVLCTFTWLLTAEETGVYTVSVCNPWEGMNAFSGDQ